MVGGIDGIGVTPTQVVANEKDEFRGEMMEHDGQVRIKSG
jgi:hypothetical protein